MWLSKSRTGDGREVIGEKRRSKVTSWILLFRTEYNLAEIGTYVAIQVTDKKFWFSYHIEIENWTSGAGGEASVK